MDELWAQSRAGSHAGRGFHYQDAVATELAVPAWRGELAALRLIPEGLEDVSLELPAHRLHLQAKSRRAHRGDFAGSELVDSWRHLVERLRADPTAHVGLVLERRLAGVDTGFERTFAQAAPGALGHARTPKKRARATSPPRSQSSRSGRPATPRPRTRRFTGTLWAAQAQRTQTGQ